MGKSQFLYSLHACDSRLKIGLNGPVQNVVENTLDHLLFVQSWLLIGQCRHCFTTNRLHARAKVDDVGPYISNMGHQVGDVGPPFANRE